MFTDQVLSPDELSHWSTEELKQKVLHLTQNQDTKPLSQKVLFYKNSLAPLVEELSQRNPFKRVEEQLSIVPGVWTPVWSTIPFQDVLPGRIREQSYQIFHDNGYYANIARYVPGYKLPLLQKISSILVAYDLMLIQSFEVVDDRWHIKNIGIKQAVRVGAIPLNINKAEDWFTNFINSQPSSNLQTTETKEVPELKNLDRNTAKSFKRAFLATPRFEHLYIDSNFRIVKTQRETKQRASYTIAIRRK
ncbi:MAG: hypothetical protein JOZ78_22860 [Chroococcidiopsidaceae cyanobacterium CP_BM_ER_R8_30]|nr:hypothetical protein [Chroococcidiopsidaceae cyanobacterium CP_BM_ER_R8_30]